jgi:hypothetical protein
VVAKYGTQQLWALLVSVKGNQKMPAFTEINPGEN